jgi:hypothetical protein
MTRCTCAPPLQVAFADPSAADPVIDYQYAVIHYQYAVIDYRCD